MMTPITEALAATGGADPAGAYPIIQWALAAFFLIVGGLMTVSHMLKGKSGTAAPKADEGGTYVYLDGPLQRGLEKAESIASSFERAVELLNIIVNKQANANELRIEFDAKITETRHGLRNEQQERFGSFDRDLEKLVDRVNELHQKVAVVSDRQTRK